MRNLILLSFAVLLASGEKSFNYYFVRNKAIKRFFLKIVQTTQALNCYVGSGASLEASWFQRHARLTLAW